MTQGCGSDPLVLKFSFQILKPLEKLGKVNFGGSHSCWLPILDGAE